MMRAASPVPWLTKLGGEGSRSFLRGSNLFWVWTDGALGDTPTHQAPLSSLCQRWSLREDLATLRPPPGHHLNHQPGL